MRLWVQLKRWCVLQRVHSGDGCDLTTDTTQGHRPRSKSERNLIILQVNINGIKNKLEELKLLIHDTHAWYHHNSGNQAHPSSSYRVITLSSSIALCMLELYCWTLEGRTRCRGVRGVSIATCEPCSLLPARIHMLCLRWNIPTSSFVLCYKCIQFLVCSGISSWAKGYHAPWLDPLTGRVSMHVHSPPVFSSNHWLGQLLLGSELVVPTTTAYNWWNCQVFRPANCCQHIPPNRFFGGFPDPSQFAAAKLTHYSSKPQRPSDSSRSWQCILLSGDVMYTRTLALLQSIHVRCVLAMLQVVGWAIYAIAVLDGYIRSVLVFKTQQSIDELRTRFAALAIPHPLYRNYNRHQFQHKLSMRIHSPSCNSTQMASATNWRNQVNS